MGDTAVDKSDQPPEVPLPTEEEEKVAIKEEKEEGDKKKGGGEEEKEDIATATATATDDDDDGNKPTEDSKEEEPQEDETMQDDEEKDHARVDDPVEPPARNAPKATGPDTPTTPKRKLPIDPSSILSRLFDPDRKQKPALWTHIKLVAPGPADQPPPGHLKWRSKDAIAAYCLKCKKQFTYTRGTSKTISRHMMAYHGLITTDGEMVVSGAKRGAPSHENVKEPPLKKRKTGTIEQPSPSEEHSTSIKLLKWMVGSFRPFSIVQDKGWKDFVGTLASDIPTTQQELIHLASIQMEQATQDLRHQLQDCQDYSVSSEVFEDSNGKRYCSVKVTFCTSQLERKSFTLAVVALDDSTSPFKAIENVLEQFQLPTEKITSVTRKGGDNNTALPEWLNKDQDRTCVLHQMDTLVMEALSKGTIGDLLKELEKHVQTHYGYLKSGNVFAKLPQDTSSSSSTSTTTSKDVYMLLQKYKHPQTHVEVEATKSLTKWTPTSEQEFMIQVLTAILKPFYDAIHTLSGEKYPTIGLTIPVFRRIRDVLENINVQDDFESSNKDEDNSKAVATMKEFQTTFVQSFSTAFDSILGEDPTLMWTIPLDPRLIHMRGLSNREKESVTKMLIEKVQQCKLSSNVNEEEDNNNKDATDNISNNKKDDKKTEQGSTMGGIFWGDGEEDQSQKENVVASYARTSVDRYLTTVKTHRRIDDPLQWWNANQSQFPELGTLARIWLGASATYEGSSNQGHLQQFSEENLEMIVFLHDNMDLISSTRLVAI